VTAGGPLIGAGDVTAGAVVGAVVGAVDGTLVAIVLTMLDGAEPGVELGDSGTVLDELEPPPEPPFPEPDEPEPEEPEPDPLSDAKAVVESVTLISALSSKATRRFMAHHCLIARTNALPGFDCPHRYDERST
jgi:hypothetical protein